MYATVFFSFCIMSLLSTAISDDLFLEKPTFAVREIGGEVKVQWRGESHTLYKDDQAYYITVGKVGIQNYNIHAAHVPDDLKPKVQTKDRTQSSVHLGSQYD
ncbi:hypothetical protein Ddc_10926 [Ditylenchus destructor]|nr:hypothetical protein Ddc_10926 [Ditylenchus destructor]